LLCREQFLKGYTLKCRSGITPRIISVPGIRERNKIPRKKEAIKNIEKGFIAQLTNKVKNTGLGAFPVFIT